MIMNDYAVFSLDNTEEWASYEYFGMWTGRTPQEAMEKSNIKVGRPKATHVYVLPWGGGTLFERGMFTEVSQP